MAPEEKANYRETLDRAVASKHNDKWAERTDSNTGPTITASMFEADDDFAADYAMGMKERYSYEPSE
jgi:hypothetical protein